MKRTMSLEQHHSIAPGFYAGLWSAYTVRIIFHNGKISGDIDVTDGVRGINCSCEIEVNDNGWIYVD